MNIDRVLNLCVGQLAESVGNGPTRTGPFTSGPFTSESILCLTAKVLYRLLGPPPQELRLFTSIQHLLRSYVYPCSIEVAVNFEVRSKRTSVHRCSDPATSYPSRRENDGVRTTAYLGHR